MKNKILILGVILTLLSMLLTQFNVISTFTITISLDELARAMFLRQLSLFALFGGVIIIFTGFLSYLKQKRYQLNVREMLVFFLLFLLILGYFQYFWFVGTMDCVIARSTSGVIIDWANIRDCSY